jgi:shikimate dehydrogenase
LEADLKKLGATTEIASAGVDQQAWRSACRESELVVHATPVGMRPGEEPILSSDAFHGGQRVYDLIYMFPETALMRSAHLAGAQTANGLGMLLHQGALSFSIWTGRDAPLAVMRRALEEAVYGRKAEDRDRRSEIRGQSKDSR